MFDRAEARIDLGRIAENVEHLKKLSGVPVMAVVKADAYGHGLVPVARAALDAGAASLGVALLEEALTLREAGITAPILAWLVPPGSDFQASGCITILISLHASIISSLAEVSTLKTNKRPRVHIRARYRNESWRFS
jgi:alanine racemase